MKKYKVDVYEYSELSQEVKDKIFTRMAEDVTYPDYPWWDDTFYEFVEDLEKVDIEINQKDISFDLDRRDFNVRDMGFPDEASKSIWTALELLDNVEGLSFSVAFMNSNRDGIDLRNLEFNVDIDCWPDDFALEEDDNRDLAKMETNLREMIEKLVQQQVDVIQAVCDTTWERLKQSDEYYYSKEYQKDEVEQLVEDMQFTKDGLEVDLAGMEPYEEPTDWLPFPHLIKKEYEKEFEEVANAREKDYIEK